LAEKKTGDLKMNDRKAMIDGSDGKMSLRAQCKLFGVNRSGLYYQAKPNSGVNIELMHLIDEEFTRHPSMGVARMTAYLRDEGKGCNIKRVCRLMRVMGLEAIYPKPHTSRANQQHEIYPYLLRDVVINRSNQVWSTDITYVRLLHGFAYWVAIMDWHSRSVLSFRLSNTMDTAFCLEALHEAIDRHGCPEIFNSDQGAQFTSHEFIGCLKEHPISISMDGRGRALDNVFIERLWRTVKYEDVYIKGYETMMEAQKGLTAFFEYYNTGRLHQSLGYRRPMDVYFDRREKLAA
jgi:putative transposase